jgi:hypothetical protein
VREEESSSQSLKESMQQGTETEVGAEAGFKAGVNGFVASAEVSAKASYKAKNTSAYSRTMDAAHSQKFNQDLSASSLMRTKIVPVPPPELLVERIKILLDKLRKEAEEELKRQQAAYDPTKPETKPKELDQIVLEKVEERVLERVGALSAAK